MKISQLIKKLEIELKNGDLDVYVLDYDYFNDCDCFCKPHIDHELVIKNRTKVSLYNPHDDEENKKPVKILTLSRE